MNTRGTAALDEAKAFGDSNTSGSNTQLSGQKDDSLNQDREDEEVMGGDFEDNDDGYETEDIRSSFSDLGDLPEGDGQ